MRNIIFTVRMRHFKVRIWSLRMLNAHSNVSCTSYHNKLTSLQTTYGYSIIQASQYSHQGHMCAWTAHSMMIGNTWCTGLLQHRSTLLTCSIQKAVIFLLSQCQYVGAVRLEPVSTGLYVKRPNHLDTMEYPCLYSTFLPTRWVDKYLSTVLHSHTQEANLPYDT